MGGVGKKHTEAQKHQKNQNIKIQAMTVPSPKDCFWTMTKTWEGGGGTEQDRVKVNRQKHKADQKMTQEIQEDGPRTCHKTKVLVDDR